MWVITVRVAARALDGMYGRYATGIPVRIERSDNDGWVPIASGETGADGFVSAWADEEFGRGVHRVIFDSSHYFAGLGLVSAYAEIAVTFLVRDEDDNFLIQAVQSPHSYYVYFGAHS
jgi:5-hydroxyisourate hydrolase